MTIQNYLYIYDDGHYRELLRFIQIEEHQHLCFNPLLKHNKVMFNNRVNDAGHWSNCSVKSQVGISNH